MSASPAKPSDPATLAAQAESPSQNPDLPAATEATAADSHPAKQRRAHGSVVDILAIAVLALVVVLANLPAFLGGQVFYYEDFVAWFAPTRFMVGDALRTGSIAQWDPWVGVGQPLVFNSAAAPLYPLNVLQLLGDNLAGLHRMIVLHFVLAGAMMYALVRSLGGRPAVALPAGVAFAFSGPLVSYAQENPYHLFGMTWLPLSLLCFLRALERTSWRWALGAGIAMALMLYGGEPQVWYFNGFSLGVVALAYSIAGSRTNTGWRRRSLLALGFLALTFLSGLMLAVGQIVATSVFLSGSARAIGESAMARLHFSMHPSRLLTLVLPYFTGVMLPENSLWGNGFVDWYRYWMHAIYVGLFALVFAAAAFRRTAIRPWLAPALALASIFFLLMSLGRYAGLFAAADYFVPGIRMFRYPEKWAGAAAVPLILLGALGLETTLADRRIKRAAVAIGLLAVVAIAAIAASGSLRGLIQATALYPAPDLVEAAVSRIRQDGIHAALVMVSALALLVALTTKRIRTTAIAWLLAAVAIVDCVLVGPVPLTTTEPTLFRDPGPVFTAIQAKDPHARFRRVPQMPGHYVPADSAGYLANAIRARWTGGLHSAIGLQRNIMVHGPPISLAEGELLNEALQGAHPVEGGAVLATRFYVVADSLPPAWMVPHVNSGRLRVVESFPGIAAVLVEDTEAPPRAWRVSRTEIEEGSNRPAMLRARLASSFDFRETAVVDSSETLVAGKLVNQAAGPMPRSPPAAARPSTSAEPVATAEPATVAKPPTAMAAPSTAGPESPLAVQFLIDTAEVVELATEGTEPGLLFLADSFCQGWRAYVNGIATPIHRTNYVGRGVLVPNGHSVVRFEYHHPHLGSGLMISGATAAGVLVLFALGRLKGRRK
ncbi:MAG: glycosyltransferase family 39 protein [Pseudomonadota bacterium]